MASDNMVDKKMFTTRYNDKDIVKLVVIASFILISTLITIFALSEQGHNINSSILFLFPQLYYIPIILLSIWYPKRSIQATIMMVVGFLAIVTYYYFIGIQIDPFIAGLNAALYLWVVIATTQLAHNSGLINLKYLDFFKNANTGLLVINQNDQKVLKINQKIVDIFEYETDEIVGKTTDELKKLLFKDRTDISEIFRTSGEIKDLKTRLVKKSGETVTTLISCRNNKYEKTIECIVADITEQEKENISANEEKRKLLDFMSSSQDLMFVLDENGCILKFHFMDESIEKSDFEEFIGKDLSEILEKPGSSDYNTLIKEVIDNGKTIPFNAEIRFKGIIRHFLIIFGPYNDSTGRTTGIIGNLHQRDREKKKSTKDLVNEFETERWNNFVNTAAHELRTPLQPVIGYLHLILDEPEQSGLNEATIEILTKCLKSADRESSIVEKMLETGLMNSYTVKLSLSDINLHRIIDDIISIGGYLKSSEILIGIPPNTQIRADRDRIYQVFEGIISNAVKYNTNPRKIEISYNKDDINHYISFKDNGTGIPKNNLENIFEPFYISNSEKLSREYGRIGLGLSIARKYIRVHGGDMYVESIEGKGSTFTVILPKDVNCPKNLCKY